MLKLSINLLMISKNYLNNMTKKQIKLAWEKLIRETHKRSKLDEQLKNKEISLLGDLLLFAQVLLAKVEAGENNVFNSIIYRKTINFYCTGMKKYV